MMLEICKGAQINPTKFSSLCRKKTGKSSTSLNILFFRCNFFFFYSLHSFFTLSLCCCFFPSALFICIIFLALNSLKTFFGSADFHEKSLGNKPTFFIAIIILYGPKLKGRTFTALGNFPGFPDTFPPKRQRHFIQRKHWKTPNIIL